MGEKLKNKKQRDKLHNLKKGFRQLKKKIPKQIQKGKTERP